MKVVSDARRVRAYVGQHRQKTVKRGLMAMGGGALVTGLVWAIVDAVPFSIKTAAILVLLAMMAVPSEFVAP